MAQSHEQIQIAWFRAFLAVHHAGSFTAAAHEIHRSQSRVSALVGQLERHLGADLFIRGQVPIMLTDQGEELLPYAQSIVDQVEEAATAVSVRSGIVRGRVSIQSYPGMTAFMLAEVIREFQDRYTQARVTLWEGPLDRLRGHDRADALGHGLADFVVRPGGSYIRPGIDVLPLFREPMVCLVPADHEVAGEEWVDPEIFARGTVIMIGNVEKDHAATDDLLVSVGVHPEQRRIVGFQPTTVTALVRAGLGIGILPMLAARLLDTRDGVRLLRIRGEAFIRNVSVLRRADRHYPPVAQQFLKALLAAPLPTGLEPVESPA